MLSVWHVNGARLYRHTVRLTTEDITGSQFMTIVPARVKKNVLDVVSYPARMSTFIYRHNSISQMIT